MTIFRKSLITLGLAAFGFSAAFVISIMVFMNSLYHETNIAGLGNTAKTLMDVIGEDRFANIFLNEIDEQNIQNILPIDAYDNYRLTLIASSGYVLWDSHVTERLVNHIDREEVIAALKGNEGSSKRESVSTGMERIYYALPVFDNYNNVIGVFRLSSVIPEFGSRVSPVILPFLIFLAVIIVTAFWAIYAYSSSLSSSLGRLVRIAQSSAPLLSGSGADTNIAPEFLSLERAMRAMSNELNTRFLQVKSESSRLEAILNGMAEAVFAMDSSLKLHLVNPKARELFKLGNGDINSITLLEATRSTELVDTVKKAISGGTPVETELTFHGVSEQHLLAHASPLDSVKDKTLNAGSAAKAAGVVLVLQEITQLVKLEKIRKDFVANVSHELRTPIQLIKGFAETVSDAVSSPDKESKKEMLHFLDIIRKNAAIMENLTNDLLTLSSLENNATDREMEEVNIASLINEAVSSVEPQAKKKQIEISAKCSEDLNAELHGYLIIQALINLLDNGVKYSQPKSKLWISAYLAGEDGEQKNDALVFEVRDKGIGIPSEHLERIFERFYRVDRSRSKEAGGTGLGLSIVRHIALLHKGDAEAESHAGEGSIFRIKIPFQNR